MWRILLFSLIVAGCAQLPPSPQDIQAKKFESLPDKSVIYPWMRFPLSYFYLVNEQYGRAVVMRSQLIP